MLCLFMCFLYCIKHTFIRVRLLGPYCEGSQCSTHRAAHVADIRCSSFLELCPSPCTLKSPFVDVVRSRLVVATTKGYLNFPPLPILHTYPAAFKLFALWSIFTELIIACSYSRHSESIHSSYV